jgi:hypothetical protein
MAARKETPDILGNLLDKPSRPEVKPEKDTSTPEYHNAGIPVHQNTIMPEYHNTGTPAGQHTSTPAGQKKRSQQAGEASAPAVKEAPGEKAKATYYLAADVLDELEEAWITLRRLAPQEVRGSVSKSLIVEAALRLSLAELEKAGEKSKLARKVL